ncbi:hypothetical protein RB653_010183 [Dictyostelium firmibasis]|uniref:Uncharacterized protein n=1 Tax=Dictyostelium firmibasis TaxID=79012 RepID=A0AAN7TLE9_9MYCE
MNKIYICTSVFKIFLSLIIIGILVTLINIDSNNEILIITTKTYTHPININGSEIRNRDYKETKYYISLKHIDVVIKNDNNKNNNNYQIIKINRYLYDNIDKNHFEINSHTSKIENLLYSFIVFMFLEFIIILLLFLLPIKSKMNKQPKIVFKIKISLYLILMVIFIPLFIVMMYLVTKDLKKIFLSIPILNPICLDSNSNEIGFCKEYYFGNNKIENNILKDYYSFNKINNLITSFESYEWENGPLYIKLVSILIQVILLYIIIVSLIVFEYGNKKIKRTNNPYIIRN